MLRRYSLMMLKLLVSRRSARTPSAVRDSLKSVLPSRAPPSESASVGREMGELSVATRLVWGAFCLRAMTVSGYWVSSTSLIPPP